LIILPIIFLTAKGGRYTLFSDERIKVGNTFIRVDNYDLHENERLEKPFMVYDAIRHKSYLSALYYDKENRSIYLPAGIDLWWVRKCLDEKYFTKIDPIKYKTFSNVRMKHKPRDEEQIEYLKFMIGIDEYKDNSNAPQLFLNANTGKGKTYCSIATMCFYQIKSIVITGSNTLLNQWHSSILEFTNLKDSDVFRINGSDICNMILNGSSNKANNAKIYLCSHGTIRSFGERYGWDKVYALFEYLGIGLKFYDESHTNFANILMIDYFTNTYKTYYVTATAGRSDWQEDKIFKVAIKNVPLLNLFDQNKDPHTSYIAIKWNSNPTPMDISRCKSRSYGLDRNAYINYLTTKPEFYEMMHVVMDLVLKCQGKALLYIGTNDGILRVYKWICDNYPEFLGDIGIFTSIVSKEDKMIAKGKRLILSTTKSAGLGEDIKGLKMTVVLAEPFKSNIIFRQTLGRTRDDNTVYIEMVDLGFKYTRKYYYSKIPTANIYAKDVSDTTIDKYEMKRRVQGIVESRTHWQKCPIRLKDDRFDFDSVLPDFLKENNNGVQSPIRFVGNDKYDENGFLR
jgi:hypothetical protein